MRYSHLANLCHAYNLGLIEYENALRLQRNLAEARLKGEVPDVILLLEHPPVLTIGTSGGESDILASTETLSQENMSVVPTDRGGGITYHGPGQLVCYPIFDLRNKGKDIHQYVRNLEEVIIRTLASLSVAACRIPGYPGIWVGNEKVCAVGIQVTKWVTRHGFALNVNNNLKHFSYIRACGIPDKGVISISHLVGHKLQIEAILPSLLKSFSQVFNLTIEEKSLSQLAKYQ